MAKHPKIVVEAGHRSTDRTGGLPEMDLTQFLAEAYVDEFRRRGYVAQWWQRDLDGDDLPTETRGTRHDVARGIGKWLKDTPGELIYLSCHYNGAHSDLHAIVPDNVDLDAGVPGGDDPNDTAANNKLDVRLGTAIMRRMHDAGLGSLFNGMLNIPGIMSERESGVGKDGDRLGVFAHTAPSRKRAVRLVIEHGGTEDPAAKRNDFTKRCAIAVADAIDEIYGDQDQPAERKAIPDPVEDKRFDGRFYAVADRKRRTALKDVTPRQGPSENAPTVGATVKKGKTVTLQYVTTGEDGTLWLVSTRGSYFPAAAFIPGGG